MLRLEKFIPLAQMLLSFSSVGSNVEISIDPILMAIIMVLIGRKLFK